MFKVEDVVLEAMGSSDWPDLVWGPGVAHVIGFCSEWPKAGHFLH